MRMMQCCRKTIIPLKPKETTMQYKTICLQMIQDRPEMYDQLLSTRTLLSALNRYATQLRASHRDWIELLTQARPGSSESQISSEALEIALKELADSLRHACPVEEDEPLSLDAAMAFIRHHTPPA
jgi:hypothetical protein